MEDSKYISRWKSSKTILKVAFRSDVHKSSPEVKRWKKKNGKRLDVEDLAERLITPGFVKRALT